MKILSIGSLNIDYVYSVDEFVCPGETKNVSNLTINCGGKGLNQAIAAAKAGLCVYHAGVVGNDGAFLCEELKKYGVSTEYVKTIDQKTGHAIIQVNQKGQNCILVYPGTNGMLDRKTVSGVLDHFGSEDVLMLQKETNMVPEIIRMASRRNMRIAFNPSPLSGDIREYPLELVRWLFVNETEGAAIAPAADENEILNRLHSRCPDTEIIMTLGEKGSMVADKNGSASYPACKVTPVDTTGAGDTFVGFYLRASLLPVPDKTPAEFATIASGISVTRPGAAKSIPNYEETMTKLKEKSL